jgi:carbon monoxide dehydrogenase subunit G
MLETLNVTKTIDAPNDAVWAAIAAIGGIDRWLPVIESCRVEGEGVGALRFLRVAASAGGGEIEDRVDEIDHQRRRFRYTRLRSPFPVESYVGTVEVRPAPEDRSEVSWTVDIDVAPDARDEMAALFSGALSELIGGIEREVSQETASR